MMRITIRLDDDLLRRAKVAAAASGLSLSEVIDDALRATLAVRPSPRPVADLPTYRGHGLQPGVDLDDSAELTGVMDGVGH
jgi:plasmid stability protein